MAPQADIRWGKPLEDYAPSYDITAAQKRGLVTQEMEKEAEKVKNRIYGEALSVSGQVPNPGNLVGLKDITLPMLKAVLELTISPRHLHFFADPIFLGGCIRLLAQVKPEGKLSPFSHEFGYLCFRIIAIGIGACILKATDNLDVAIQNIQQDIDTELLLMFSGHVSRVLLDKIHARPSDCDWVMGWASTEGHPDLQPFLSSSDLLHMLNFLWEDRKLFVQALSRTYLPGLSGVVFVLWRYTCSSSENASVSSNKLMTAPFCELLWRSMLVATEDQFTTLHFINNFVYYDKKQDSWDQSPKYVDLEDSCTLLNTLSARLVPADRRLFKPLSMLPLVTLLQTMIELVQPGSEGCYPALLTGIVERFWTALEENELPEDTILTAGSVFLCLGELLSPLDHNHYSTRTAKVDLVKALKEHDFLELLGRLILLLEPSDEPSPYSPYIPKNTWFLANTLHIVTTLVDIAPDTLLIDQFEARIDDWHKAEHALLLSRLIDGSYPDTYKTLHDQCLRTWWSIGEKIGIQSRMLDLARYECSYSRCPQGRNLFFVEFTCTLCFGEKLRYCSALCQSKDWSLDHGGGSHRQRCRPKARPAVRASGNINVDGRQEKDQLKG